VSLLGLDDGCVSQRKGAAMANKNEKDSLGAAAVRIKKLKSTKRSDSVSFAREITLCNYQTFDFWTNFEQYTGTSSYFLLLKIFLTLSKY
jgi:hypothetical protein